MADASTAVVIGGTSGIGRAIAERFAEDGYQVVVAGRDAVRGKEAAGACETAGAPRALFVQTDVADPASVEALARAVGDAFGAPHVMVNCAGILQSGKHVLDQDLDEDEKMWRINYRGTLLGCQVFGRLMSAAGRGAILNVGSLASFAPLSLPAYTPGKHAVLALTQILAAELGPRGVRVNAVAPGYTLSDGLKTRIAKGERNPEAIQATTALRRFVEPRDVAEAALFLCSDRAASITGVTLPSTPAGSFRRPTRYICRETRSGKRRQSDKDNPMSDIQRFDTRIHHGVIHNGTLYLTGQVAKPGQSAADQMREVLGKIDALLAKAGTDKTRILHVQMWLDDIRDFDEVNMVWDAWMPKEHAPARSSGEGRMARPGMLVELIVTAAV